jgi:hypothetical protein
MKAAGYPATNSWKDIGIERLSVRKMEGILRRSRFETFHQETKIKKAFAPFRRVPLLRELFISEMVGVYRKPML